VVVDDGNLAEVRRGAREGLRDGGLEVLWERTLPGERGWWRGLGVFFVERR
jgi:hypothetical protein